MKTKILKMKNLCNEIKTWANLNAIGDSYHSKDGKIFIFFSLGHVEDVQLRINNTSFFVHYSEVIDWLASPPTTEKYDRISMSADFLSDESMFDPFFEYFSKLFAEIKWNETERLRAEAEEKKQASIKELERKLSILKGERKEYSLLEK